MILKDLSFDSPLENLLYDDVLLSFAEKGLQGEVLRFWESSQTFVVLGRICKPEDDLKIEAIRRDKIPVLRRSSGGGTVLQGKGCLNYSLILSKELNPVLHDLRKSYEFILGKVVLALQESGVEARFYPISDIALVAGQKKFSGNAQKRGRKYILHHGTILYDFDIEQIERYLKMPKDVPVYRQERSHLDFVVNVPIDTVAFKKQLEGIFKLSREENFLTDQEKECLKAFKMNKTKNESSLSPPFLEGILYIV